MTSRSAEQRAGSGEAVGPDVGRQSWKPLQDIIQMMTFNGRGGKRENGDRFVRCLRDESR